MNWTFASKFAALSAAVALMAGCATKPQAQYDYTAFKAAKPASILVLPPLNNSPDVNASFGLLSQSTMPLAESGYYVLPVTLVAETFKQNGLTTPADIHELSAAKLREIFGADAALYIAITRYGTTYTVLNSVVEVAANARLVDLRSGQTLWSGAASASSAENDNSGQGNPLAMLVAAVVKQIINSSTDVSFRMAGTASQRLLWAGRPNGMLYGPRSPKFGTD